MRCAGSSTRPGSPSARRRRAKDRCPIRIRCRSAASARPAPRAANLLARERRPVVIVLGSRLSDFTTASKTAFQFERVQFIAINVAEIDAAKHAALALVGDARATLDELLPLVAGYHVSADYTEHVAASQRDWRAEVDRVCDVGRVISDPATVKQAQVIGVLQDTLSPTDVIVCAAGSLPGDLHKLWRARDPKAYHMEYGYSCMGYEIAGGLGVKMAAAGSARLRPDRRRVSTWMMAQEIVTAVQERVVADHRPARQPRLRQHWRAVRVGRQRRVRHALSRTQSGDRRAGRRHPADRSRRQRRLAWRHGVERADTIAAFFRDGGSPRRPGAHHGGVGHRRPGRSRSARRRLRVVVGRAGRRGLDQS